MKPIRLVGYRPGLNSVALIRALNEHCGLPLAESKNIVEELIAGGQPCVRPQPKDALGDFVKAASELGVTLE